MGIFSKFFQRQKAVAPLDNPVPEQPPRSLQRQRGVRAVAPTQSGTPRTVNAIDATVHGFSSRNYYEALSSSADRTPIPLITLYALKYIVKGMNRERLALLGEYLYENDGLVGLAIDTIANYSADIQPSSACPDSECAKAYDAYFTEWCKRADFTGRFCFSTLLRLCCKAVDFHGEMGVTIVADNGFPQLQLIETHFISSRRVEDGLKNHADGVVTDSKGALAGYLVEEEAALPPRFVSTSEMLLLYDADRITTYRGYSPMRRGMNDVRDRKDIQGFEKLATKISAALAAVLEGSDFEDQDVWGNETGDAAGPEPGNEPPADATPQEKNISTADLLGGDIPVLPDGKKLKQLDNNRPGERVMELLDYLGGCFVSGLGLPPAFLIDAKLTGPNQRSVNGKAQRKFDQRQMLIAHLVEWVWVRVIAHGIAKDGLPTAPGWTSMEWQGPSKVSIDEGRDAQQWRADVQSGLMTKAELYGKRSLNWQRETDQGFVEDEYTIGRAVAVAEKFKVPVEIILARWGYTAAKAPTQTVSTDETTQPPTD